MCLLGKYVCDFWYSENKCALKKQDLWQVLKENCPLLNETKIVEENIFPVAPTQRTIEESM
jgi:hypothetical protein